jgi:hypothetical protein
VERESFDLKFVILATCPELQFSTKLKGGQLRVVPSTDERRVNTATLFLVLAQEEFPD